MSDEITYASIKDIKVGRFVMIDGVPCKVVDVEISAPGKHGSAKARITGVGLFNGQKKTLLKPSHDEVEVPVITKTKAQVVSIAGSSMQLMDLESYAMFDLPVQDDLKGIKAGDEVEVMDCMGSKAVSRILVSA